MLLDVNESQLVLIDFQQRLMPVIHDQASVLANGVRLARIARLMQVPALATEQNPERLGPTEPALHEVCRKTLPKMHFSACADGLVQLLRPQASAPARGNARSLPKHLQQAAAPERGSIVLAGCEAHVCVLQTALELLDEEFEVWVVTDACGSRTERNRDAAFDRLAGAGVELVTTEMVAFEWLRGAQHPLFKDVLTLIK